MPDKAQLIELENRLLRLLNPHHSGPRLFHSLLSDHDALRLALNLVRSLIK